MESNYQTIVNIPVEEIKPTNQKSITCREIGINIALLIVASAGIFYLVQTFSYIVSGHFTWQ